MDEIPTQDREGGATQRLTAIAANCALDRDSADLDGDRRVPIDLDFSVHVGRTERLVRQACVERDQSWVPHRQIETPLRNGSIWQAGSTDPRSLGRGGVV